MRPNRSTRWRAPRAALLAVTLLAATLSSGLSAPPALAVATVPAVTSFFPAVSTANGSFAYNLYFNEPVTGLDAGDFGTSRRTCSVAFSTSNSINWTITLSSCPEGQVWLALDAQSVTAALGPITGPTAPAISSGSVAVDHTAPTSSVSFDAAGTGPSAAYSVFGSPVYADPVSAQVASGVQWLDVYYATGSDMANPTKCGTYEPGEGGPVSVTCTLPTTPGTYWLGSAARDFAGNVETLTADDSVVVDGTPPSATVTQRGNLTNAQPVQFDVSYSEPVFGLTVDDFTRTGGCTTAGITGTGPYVLSLSGCPDGAVSVTHILNSLTDIGGNTGPATAGTRTTTLDTTRPASVGSITPTVTAASSVTVDYAASDATSGLAQVNAYRTLVDQPPAPVLCGTTASSATSGTVTCTLPDGDWYVYTIANDVAGNTELAPAIADDKILRDGTGPSVTITPDATHTNGSPTYGLVFSEDATGVDAPDFMVSPPLCTSTTLLGSGTDWSVTLNGCPEGSVTLSLSPATVADALGNLGPAALASAAPVVVDRALPTVSSIVLAAASDSGRLNSDRLTNTTSPVFTMTFSEPLETGPSAGAISFTGSGSANCTAGTPTGGGAEWSVPVTNCNQGTVVLHYEGSTALDLAGNTDPAVDTASATVTIDTTAPTLTLTPSGSSPTSSTSLGFVVQGNEALNCSTLSGTNGVDFAFTNVASTDTSITGVNSCALPVTSSISGGATGATMLTKAASFSVSDDAGNPATAISGSPASVTVDRAAPTVVLAPIATAVSATGATYTATFDEPTGTPAASAFSIAGSTATGCFVAPPEVSGDHVQVVVECASTGMVQLRLLANSVMDEAGNLGPSVDVDAATVTLDLEAPVVSSLTVTPRVGGRVAGSSIPVTVAWTGTDPGGTGIASYAVERSPDGGATWGPATGTFSGASLATTMPATGSVLFRARGTDNASNTGAFGPASTTSPTSASLVQQGAKAVTYKGTWTTAKSSSFSGGSAKYAKTKGRSASYTFTGRSVAFVSTNASNRGRVKIYVNGTLAKTVDLKGATKYGAVVWQQTWSTSAKRTVKVVVQGTSGRPRADVDAFVVLK